MLCVTPPRPGPTLSPTQGRPTAPNSELPGSQGTAWNGGGGRERWAQHRPLSAALPARSPGAVGAPGCGQRPVDIITPYLWGGRPALISQPVALEALLLSPAGSVGGGRPCAHICSEGMKRRRDRAGRIPLRTSASPPTASRPFAAPFWLSPFLRIPHRPPRSCARSPRSPPEVPFSLTAAAVNGDRRLASPPGSPLGGCGDVRVHPGGSPLQEPLWGCHWRGAEGCALYPSMAVRSPPPEVFRCFLRHAEFSSLQCFVCGEDGGGDREGVS